MTACDLFIQNLLRYRPIKLAHDESIDTWGKDVDFLILCADIGRSVADSFDVFSIEERQKIFKIIEVAMNSDNEKLSTAVATGLLEAMYIKAEKTPSLLMQINPMLGSKTKNYLDSWINWQT